MTTIRPHFLFAMIVSCFVAAFTLPAQATEIGVINVQQILQESKAAKSIRNQLETKQKSFQKELDQKQKKLLDEDKKLAEQRNKISKEAFEKKVKEFQNKATEAQRTIQTKKASLDKGFSDALNTIQKKVTQIAAGIAKDKSLDLVIANSQVLYANNKLDITQEVLKKLDSSLPSVTVNVK